MYYRIWVFNGTKPVPVLKPFKSVNRCHIMAERYVNQPYRIAPARRA